MDSMICYNCVLKHLSTALSFGKEVMSGHSLGDELDHRIDFIGEISNAEQHLELIDKDLFTEISTYRKEIQGKDVLLEPEDLEFIRKLYIKVENVKNGIENITLIPESISENPDIVYLNVTNKDFFDLSYKTLKLHLKNYAKIYVLNTSIDLSEYNDLIILNQNLKEFMKRTDITPDVLVLNENMGILKDIDAKQIYPTFSNKFNKDIIEDIKPTLKHMFIYDDLKIQPINVKIFNEVMKIKETKYFITCYFYWSNLNRGLSDNMISVNVDRPVCCSIRSNLKVRTFMRWNQSAFESLKRELKM